MSLRWPISMFLGLFGVLFLFNINILRGLSRLLLPHIYRWLPIEGLHPLEISHLLWGSRGTIESDEFATDGVDFDNIFREALLCIYHYLGVQPR